MQQFRSSLTRLRSLMEQKLPDGNDVHGYPGISKAALLDAVDSAYLLSQEIQDDGNPRFEVVSLKRAGSDLYKLLKDYLEGESRDGEKRVKFNDYLNGLSSLVEKTKLTYFIVVKQGLRTDEELSKIRAAIADLTVVGDELKEQKEKALTGIGDISGIVTSISDNHKKSNEFAVEIKQWHGVATKHSSELEKAHGVVVGLSTEIQKLATQSHATCDQVSEVAAAASINRDKLKNDSVSGARAAEELKKVAIEHRELLNEIRQTLGDANRVGMAASFKERKDELKLQQNTWQAVFVGAVTLIVLAVWQLVLPTVSEGKTQSTELIVELGLVTPLIWLGWFAAKQYGYTSKIREDYAFKSASAMAYEGHKKAAREVNKDLERVLLEFSLFNMSQNPIRLYGEGEMHGSPVHEAVDQFLRKFPVLRKVSAEAPSLGRLEVSGGEAEK